MTVRAFEILVSMPGDITRSIATARAVQYLNNTIFDHYQIGVVDIFDTQIYGQDPRSDFGIGVTFAAKMSDEQAEYLESSVSEHRKIESVEEVAYDRA